MNTTWDEYKKKWENDPKFQKAWKKTRLEYEVARTVIKARLEKSMTQAQLAKKMKTKQSVISRVESAQTKPTLSFLERLAVALGGKLEINLKV